MRTGPLETSGIPSPAGRTIALFSAGFPKPDPQRAWCDTHSTPLIYRRKKCYGYRCPAWTLVLDNNKGCGALDMQFVPAAAKLPRNVDFALSGTEPLLARGNGVSAARADDLDTLKTSRLSVAWDGRGMLYLLLVRDPDSEAGSRRQGVASSTQTGGWNNTQVRRFWRLMGVSNAAEIAAGDTVQLAYRWKAPSPVNTPLVRSQGNAFISPPDFGVTVGYVANRPIRLTLPTFPPYLMARGSLTYMYVCK